MKIIVVMREPVERVEKAFGHVYRRFVAGKEKHKPDLRRMVKWDMQQLMKRLIGTPGGHPHFLTTGLYHIFLDGWFATFPSAQIKLIQAERMFDHLEDVVKETWGFIGIDDTVNVAMVRKRSVTPAPAMPEDIRDELRGFYAYHNAELYRKYVDWSWE